MSKSKVYVRDPMGKVRASPNLKLRQFVIDDDGDLCLKLEIGHICEIKKIAEPTIPSFIKDVKNAVHGVELDKKLAEWLLDKEPTIFDGKELILAKEKQECLMAAQ